MLPRFGAVTCRARGARRRVHRRSTSPRTRRSPRSSTGSGTRSTGRSSTAKAGWRDVKIDRLNPTEIGAWRKALPARSAFGIHKALRQVLHYAVRAKLLDENPAALVPNPEPKRTEVQTFTLAELDALSAELSRPFRAIPVFAALTGLASVRVDRARAGRRRPRGGSRHGSPYSRRGHREAIREDRPLAQGRPAARESG